MSVVYSTEDPWAAYPEEIIRLIETRGLRRICEVGGGAFPLLSLEYVRQHQLEYTVLDISEAELARQQPGYRKLAADICAPDLNVGQSFDLVFSKMLAEHVRNPRRFHENVLHLLAPGGWAVHFFPTLYASPFVVNRLLPQWLAQMCFQLFACIDKKEHKRFPAYYRWCRGPTRRQIMRFEDVGYAVEEYRGFFGHRYFERFPFLNRWQESRTERLARFPNPSLTSFAIVVLRKRRNN